jgi:invasion protein IalB
MRNLAAAFGVASCLLAFDSGLAQQRPAQPRPGGAPAQPAPAQPAQPAPASPPAAEASPPPQPWRTEILNFDAWSVTCQEFREPRPRKVCQAQMQVVRQGTQQIVLSLAVLADDKGVWRAAIGTPTGVAIQPGVDVAVTGAAARKAIYETCEPTRCVAALALDDKTVKDFAAAPQLEATVVTNVGQAVKLTFPMKGFDKAWGALTGKQP